MTKCAGPRRRAPAIDSPGAADLSDNHNVCQDTELRRRVRDAVASEGEPMTSNEPSNGRPSVWSVKYGERVVRRSDVFHDYAQYGEPDGDLDMDYDFWVVRSNGSTILLDTGYDIPKKDWLGEISVTPTPVGLQKIGIDPADVDMVITSHYHYDHIGYLELFTNAQVVSGQREYDYWIGKLNAGQLEGEFATEEDLRPVLAAEKEG